jgi:two-component system chemotaxis sensor kinase CheA
MAESEFNEEFFNQFLDDYFAEADEHLRSVRRHLLEFEDSLNAGEAIDERTVNELFRSFHTLKGISAMANVSAAETLAHYMESYLRILRDGHSAFSVEGLDALIDSTKKLEEIVTAKRDEREMPGIETEIEKVKALTSLIDSPPLTPTEQPVERAKEPQGTGQRYKFVFSPTPELAGRDINVNAVRSKLESLGTIEDSRPVVKEAGKIAFEFVVVSGLTELDIEDWAADGISYELLPDADKAPAEMDASQSSRSGLFGQSNVVRVDLARLDELMLLVGELVVSRAKLDERVQRVVPFLPTDEERDLQEINQTIEKQLRDLRDGVMRVRMVPIGEVFERMQFVARDLARETGKLVKLEITGENTEIDKLLVERMLDPLLHLVRNAISHGIEVPSVREAAGKPRVGVVRLCAIAEGESVIIEISDDGNGIDREEVAEKARRRGIAVPESLDSTTILDILCTPGFSTRASADRASGRGVGMDVVKRVTDELGGVIMLETDSGEGTSFTIRLPLTLAIANALIVSVDGERYAVPQTNVREVLAVESDSVTRFENNEIIQYHGEPLPLIRLSRVFDVAEKQTDSFHAFVVDNGRNSVGIAVDRVIGQREIVIRSITDPLGRVAGISGATELGDGRAVLILDVADITRSMRKQI